MSVETIFFVFVIGLCVALALSSLLKKKKVEVVPMTASEMQGYEQERGRLKAQRDWQTNQQTTVKRQLKYGEQPLNKLFGLR